MQLAVMSRAKYNKNMFKICSFRGRLHQSSDTPGRKPPGVEVHQRQQHCFRCQGQLRLRGRLLLRGELQHALLQPDLPQRWELQLPVALEKMPGP